jgi:hypothetical protein
MTEALSQARSRRQRNGGGSTEAPCDRACTKINDSPDRTIERLIRAGGRKSEAESAHLLEGIAVEVYDPDTTLIHSDLPKVGCRSPKHDPAS